MSKNIPRILNLTVHRTTPEQALQGVFDPVNKKLTRKLMKFKHKPTLEELVDRARQLGDIAAAHVPDAAMISGPPYLVPILFFELVQRGITPLFAYSSYKKKNENGDFRHEGFVDITHSLLDLEKQQVLALGSIGGVGLVAEKS